MLARWITPFHRANGHWITDITPHLPVLFTTGEFLNFTMNTWLTSGHWVVTLNVYLIRQSFLNARIPWMSNKAPDSAYPSMLPSSWKCLYSSYDHFDSRYNENRTLLFNVSTSDADAVQLVAIITGHGNDEYGCGKFCPTSHVFIVNGNDSNSVSFGSAGTLFGCTRKVSGGGIPNEAGTWIYGRNGWCDGSAVPPWTWDVSSQVKAFLFARTAQHSHPI